jgi:hypothetical protein
MLDNCHIESTYFVVWLVKLVLVKDPIIKLIKNNVRKSLFGSIRYVLARAHGLLITITVQPTRSRCSRASALGGIAAIETVVDCTRVAKA